MTVITVPLPDYQVRTEPDHRAIGRRVDAAIRANFPGLKIIARGVSGDDHPDLSTGIDSSTRSTSRRRYSA